MKTFRLSMLVLVIVVVAIDVSQAGQYELVLDGTGNCPNGYSPLSSETECKALAGQTVSNTALNSFGGSGCKKYWTPKQTCMVHGNKVYFVSSDCKQKPGYKKHRLVCKQQGEEKPTTAANIVTPKSENPQKADSEIFHYVTDGCGEEIIGHYETKNFKAGYRCCSHDGQTCTTPNATIPHCGRNLLKKNFEEASSICKSNKQRLCTDQELLTGVCCGTGGLCDDGEVWTSTTSTSCILPGIDYPGGDIGLGVIKNSKEKCQKYCQDTPECLYFTWMDDTHAAPSLRKKCVLKNLMNVNNKGKKKNGVFSGPKFCPGPPTNISKFEKGALDEHNSLRAKHGSGPLILDRQISAKAEYWAKQCLAGKSKGHSPSGNGENLMTASWACNDDSGKVATKSWYSEIKNIDFEKMTGTGPTLHFTQVVWKGTTHIGIGCASNEKRSVIVAQYSPMGNMDGVESYRKNVKPLQ